jgi:hypothetical protein
VAALASAHQAAEIGQQLLGHPPVELTDRAESVKCLGHGQRQQSRPLGRIG